MQRFFVLLFWLLFENCCKCQKKLVKVSLRRMIIWFHLLMNRWGQVGNLIDLLLAKFRKFLWKTFGRNQLEGVFMQFVKPNYVGGEDRRVRSTFLMKSVCWRIQAQHYFDVFLYFFAKCIVKRLTHRFLSELIDNWQSFKLVESEESRDLSRSHQTVCHFDEGRVTEVMIFQEQDDLFVFIQRVLND